MTRCYWCLAGMSVSIIKRAINGVCPGCGTDGALYVVRDYGTNRRSEWESITVTVRSEARKVEHANVAFTTLTVFAIALLLASLITASCGDGPSGTSGGDGDVSEGETGK